MVTGTPLVLVVEDESLMRSILQRILKQEGYKVITASNGKRALKLAEEKKPDVILLDLMMPGMDGREVCRRVHEFSTTSRIIYLTAKSAPTNPSELKEYRNEVDAFIAKPATSKRILSTVSRVLQGAQ